MKKQLKTLEIQKSKDGRPFRMIGITKCQTRPKMWVNGEQRHHWIYQFKYLDTNTYFYIVVNPNDKIIKHYEQNE